MLHAFSYHILGHKCEWSHKCRVYPIQGKLTMYISTGNVWMCNSGMFSLEFDLFRKSLTIFEKGPPTQPSLILLTSNYCHPPYNCTTKVVFVGLTHWSVEIPLCYLCCVCCVVFLSRDLPPACWDLLVRLFRWDWMFTLADTRPFVSSTVLDYRRRSDR
jgi:hypothetical protein